MKDHRFEKSLSIEASARILVVGPPGAGKSIFSKKLSVMTGKPLYHLDDFYWQAGWRRMNNADWMATLNVLCNKPSWIIDGNHAATFKYRVAKADMVIMLDYSFLICLWRYFKRSIRRYFKINDQLPINIANDNTRRSICTIQWHLIKLIIFYRRLTKPLFMEFIREAGCQFVCLRTDTEANKFFKRIIPFSERNIL